MSNVKESQASKSDKPTPAVSVRRVHEARHGIFSGFIWADTEQGHDYWSKVYNDLIAIEEAALNTLPERCANCGCKLRAD